MAAAVWDGSMSWLAGWLGIDRFVSFLSTHAFTVAGSHGSGCMGWLNELAGWLGIGLSHSFHRFRMLFN